MLQFNELRIDSNKHLIIDVEVTTNSTIDPHSIISINHLYVGFGTNYIPNCVDYMTGITASDDEVIAKTTYDGTDYIRRVKFDIDLTSSATHVINTNAEKSLIYIRTTVDTHSIVITSCNYKEYVDGYTYDKCLLTTDIFGYLEQTNNMCADIDSLANHIAQIKGLELAVESGNFGLANNYWNKFFGNNTTNSSLTFNTGCGCRQ